MWPALEALPGPTQLSTPLSEKPGNLLKCMCANVFKETHLIHSLNFEVILKPKKAEDLYITFSAQKKKSNWNQYFFLATRETGRDCVFWLA